MKDLVINSELSAVLANVSAVDAQTLFSSENITLPKGYDKAVKSGNHIYGFVSKTFGLIKPMDVFELFCEEFEKYGIEYNVNGRIDNKGNWELRFEFQNANFTKQVNDVLKAMLAVGCGLAGSRSFYIQDMIFRLICLNGLTKSKSQLMMNKVRNTKSNHTNKLGIDFEKLMPLVDVFINSHDFIEEQEILQGMELKESHILPLFYELTKGTKFPESKFQDAYERMKFEASELGYTAMNRYLALAGLNYILEHDSMALNMAQTRDTDMILATRITDLNIGMAVKNFNTISRNEAERIEKYKTDNNGKNPRGKQKLLELI